MRFIPGAVCPTRFALAVGVAASIAGCTTHGTIQVDRPEVFTRERLIATRAAERDWLLKKLDNMPVEAMELQGIRDVRTFTGIYGSLKAQVDPVRGQLANSTLEREIANTQRAEDLDRLGYEIEKLRRERLLADLRKAEETPESPSSGAPAPTAASTPQPSPPTASSGGLLGFSSKDAFPSLPDPSKAEKTKAQLTSLEVLREELAYRDAVNAAMREQDLDDTHDRFGFSLYTLKFDVTVLPREGNSRLGKVVLGFENADGQLDDEDVKKKLFLPWAKSLQARLAREVRSLQRLLSTAESAEDLAALHGAQRTLREIGVPGIQGAISETGGSFLLSDTGFVGRVLKGMRLLSQYDKDADLSTDGRPEAAVAAVLLRYREAVGRYVSVRITTLGPDLDHGGLFAIEVAEAPGGFAAFKEDAERAAQDDCYRAYVYSITPKQHAQNISDVAAQETLVNLMASLAATLPQGSGSLDAQYIKRSQRLLHAISREPLVSSFVNGRDQFGWILGPRFYLRPKKCLWVFDTDEVEPDFEHVPVQHALTVVLAIPAHWSRLRVKGHFEWLDEYGNPEEQAPLFKPLNAQCLDGRQSDTSDGDVTIPLTGDLDALTVHMLNSRGDTEVKGPRITFDGPVLLQEGLPEQEVVVFGEDLWRNPVVFVGHQSAASYRVLPDMRGIVATFKSLSLPPSGERAKPVRTSLTVVTSSGQSTLRNVVTIFPKTAAPSREPAIAAKTSRLVEGLTQDSVLELEAPAELISADASLFVVMKQDKKFFPLADARVSGSGDRRTLRTLLTPQDVAALKAALQLSGVAALEVELRAISTDGKVEVVGAAKPGLVFFPTGKDQGTWSAVGAGGVAGTVTLDDTKLLLQGFPGLEAALYSEAEISWVDTAGTAVPPPTPIERAWLSESGGKMQITVPAGKLPLSAVKASGIRFGSKWLKVQ